MRAGFEHGGDGAGIALHRRCVQFGELLGDGVEDQVMSNSYSAAPSAPMVAWAMEVRSAVGSKAGSPAMPAGVH